MSMPLEVSPRKDKTALDVWWHALSGHWQQAFLQTCFQGFQGDHPSSEMLEDLWDREVFRFAGPSAPFPNMDFELGDLSGIKEMDHIKTLVVCNHQITTIQEIHAFKLLKGLFVQNNQIEDLSPIGNLGELEELYVQNNQVSSLAALVSLTNLRSVYCFNNKIENLEGLTEAHAESLKDFYCLPNENLSLREVVKTEKELYIACKSC